MVSHSLAGIAGVLSVPIFEQLRIVGRQESRCHFEFTKLKSLKSCDCEPDLFEEGAPCSA
jgi:hypothetical protein